MLQHIILRQWEYTFHRLIFNLNLLSLRSPSPCVLLNCLVYLFLLLRWFVFYEQLNFGVSILQKIQDSSNWMNSIWKRFYIVRVKNLETITMTTWSQNGGFRISCIISTRIIKLALWTNARLTTSNVWYIWLNRLYITVYILTLTASIPISTLRCL